MNDREIFEKVKNHLLTQGVRSFREDPHSLGQRCAYRGDNGLMCAVGCLIKDEHYNDEFEFQNTVAENVREALAKSGISLDNKSTYELMWVLQGIHDWNAPELWPNELESLAGKFDANGEFQWQ